MSAEFKIICSSLRTIRKCKRLRQGEVAERVGIAQSYLSMIERGQRDNVPFSMIVRIAEAMGVEVRVFFTEKEK